VHACSRTISPTTASRP